MTTIRKLDDVFWGASFVVLGHLLVVYDPGLPIAVLILWYVTVNLLGMVTIADALGSAVSEGPLADTLTAVEVFLSGVICTLVAVVLVRESGVAPSILAVVAGVFAVVMIWVTLDSRQDTESDAP